jgi:hypothetical protein
MSTNCTDICYPPTFAYNNSAGKGLCLDCNVYCVGLTIKMHFSSALN